ncbi:MAG: MFS transporter [Sphaerobacter sp.]|nr:MFS transporter [Sphaerobacter sp.]
MPEVGSTAPPSTAARTLRRFYLYRITWQAKFDSAIWIIYLQSRGYSLAEVGLAESAFHLAPVLLEVPAGSFADLVGRRWSLATSSLLVALSAALLWLAPSLPLVMLALFLSGASYSFVSGSDQAYLYDALGADEAGHRRYTGILGKLLGASYVVGAATTWLGAALSEISYGIPFALLIGVGLGGAWLAAGLAEAPRPRATGGGRPAIRRHVGAVRATLARRPVVGLVLLLSGLFWTAEAVAHLYLQAAFAARGLANRDIGLLVGATLLVGAAAAALSGRVVGRTRFAIQFAAIATVAGLGLVGTASEHTPLAIGAYLLAQPAYGLAEPLLLAWFNRQIPSAQRATILSVESGLFSATMIVVFPAAGLLASRLGWAALYLICGAATLTLGAAVLVAARRWPRPA